MELSKWILAGKLDGYKIMFVLFDFEDRSYYPVYFLSEQESKRYSENIISESKCKIVESHSL